MNSTDWQPRFSVRTMLLLVLVVAIGCAVWRAWPAVFFGGVLTLTLAALTAATIVACFAGGAARRAGSGFAICGWFYLFLTLGVYLEQIGSSMVTSWSLDVLIGWTYQYPTGVPLNLPLAMVVAGNCLWAGVIGLAGAFIAMSLGRSRASA